MTRRTIGPTAAVGNALTPGESNGLRNTEKAPARRARQLVHGGATWNSGVNREQVRDSVTLIGKLVPLVILTMMDNPDTLWGDAAYPVVD